MKILLLSDLHMNLRQFSWVYEHAGPYDVTVLAGDLLNVGSALDKEKQIEEVLPLLKQIREKSQLIVASGNHDGNACLPSGEEYAKWTEGLGEHGIVSDGKGFQSGDYQFTCCPWWNGRESREKMIEQIREDASSRGKHWIWIHHSPPRGSRVAWTENGNAGDPFLLRLIGEHKPDMIFCGHVHYAPFHEEGSWLDRIGPTWVFNPGMQGGDVPTCIVFDLEERISCHFSAEGKDTRRLEQ